MVDRKKYNKKLTGPQKKADRANVLTGVVVWIHTPTGARRAERVRTKHGWGFEGQSPNTRARKYKHKTE